VSLEIPKNLKIIADLTIHVVAGSIGFVIVVGAAVIISIIVKACDGVVPHWVEATRD